MSTEATAQAPDTTEAKPGQIAPATETASAAAPEGTPDDIKFTPEQQAKVNEIVEKRLAREKAKRDREVEAELRALREKVDTSAKPPAAAAPAATEDVPPKREDFEDYETYVEARALYRVEQNEKAKRAEEQMKARDQDTKVKQAEVDTKFAAAIGKAAETHGEAFEDAFDQLRRVPLPDEVGNKIVKAIALSDSGPALLHHLAMNLGEVERLAKLDPDQALKELGKIEAKLPASAPASQAPVSKAPEPIEPGGGKATVGDGGPPKDPEAYRAWRTAQREAEARR